MNTVMGISIPRIPIRRFVRIRWGIGLAMFGLGRVPNIVPKMKKHTVGLANLDFDATHSDALLKLWVGA